MARFRAGPGLDARVAAQYAVPAARRLTESLADRMRANAPDAGLWITAQDERVRPTHRDADGQVVPANLRFAVDKPAGGAELARAPRDPDLSLENRINCFPGWVDVEAVGVRASIRAPYRGPLVHLWTASGGYFACTPQHPLLTDRGWATAGGLEVGDHLVKASLGQLREAGHLPVEPDVEHMPPDLVEVHRAFAQAGHPQRVPCSAVDLYGDPVDGDVEVVAADGELLIDGVAPSTQRISELLLADPYLAHLRPRLGLHLLLRRLRAAPGRVRRCGQRLPLFGRRALHSQPQRGTPVAGLDAGRQQKPADREAADAVRTGERLLGLASGVATDQLVDVYVRDWSGHVYTLSTDIGAYTVAGGYVAANCRCLAVAVPGAIAERVGTSEVVLRGTAARATVSVQFPRIVESEHPGPEDSGGGWVARAIREAAAGMGRST